MDDARLFLCARCQCQVRICSRCDRGQQYCGARCAGIARGESRRAAARRYQHSRHGRHRHAERQRRYRERCRQGPRRAKVTHQGSAPPPSSVSLPAHRSPNREASLSVSPIPTAPAHCHFCGCPLSDFVRLGWLRSRVSR
jgi:hypothetical protein